MISRLTRIGLGGATFGREVDAATAHLVMDCDRALAAKKLRPIAPHGPRDGGLGANASDSDSP